MDVTVAGAYGVPSDATAVVLNVAVTGTSSASFLSVYPKGVSKPTASNLNWSAGETIPNLVEVPVGTGGKISVYNLAGSADVIIDVEGYVGPSTSAGAGLYTALTPARICDTRANSGAAVVSNQCNAGGAGLIFGPNSSRAIQVTGKGGVPSTGVGAVALNIAVTNTSSPSFLTAWPNDGSSRPRVEPQLVGGPDHPEPGGGPRRA